MSKKTIRYGVATMAAAALIGTGLMAPAANAASGTGFQMNSKVIMINASNFDQLNKIASQYGIDLNKLLAGVKEQAGAAKPKPKAPAAKPSTDTAAKPSTGTAAKPSTDTAAKPSTGTAAKPSTGTATQPSADTTTEGSDTTASKSDYASQVVDLVNKERQAAGLPALKTDALLTKVAVAKAKDMDANNYFSHTSPTYGSPFDMMTQFGVKYSYAGENIASGQRTPADVMKDWMNSPGHRENILKKNFTKIGVGYVNGVWVQEFTG